MGILEEGDKKIAQLILQAKNPQGLALLQEWEAASKTDLPASAYWKVVNKDAEAKGGMGQTLKRAAIEGAGANIGRSVGMGAARGLGGGPLGAAGGAALGLGAYGLSRLAANKMDPSGAGGSDLMGAASAASPRALGTVAGSKLGKKVLGKTLGKKIPKYTRTLGGKRGIKSDVRQGIKAAKGPKTPQAAAPPLQLGPGRVKGPPPPRQLTAGPYPPPGPPRLGAGMSRPNFQMVDDVASDAMSFNRAGRPSGLAPSQSALPSGLGEEAAFQSPSQAAKVLQNRQYIFDQMQQESAPVHRYSKNLVNAILKDQNKVPPTSDVFQQTQQSLDMTRKILSFIYGLE